MHIYLYVRKGTYVYMYRFNFTATKPLTRLAVHHFPKAVLSSSTPERTAVVFIFTHSGEFLAEPAECGRRTNTSLCSVNAL